MSAVQVRDLRVDLVASGADVVSEINFVIEPGEVLGMVGESGSGKTTVGLALLGYARRGTRISGGSILVGGEDLLALSPSETRKRRGRVVSYVPQEPTSALNPALRIGRQLSEILDVHASKETAESKQERIAEVLDEVALASDRTFLRRYPHQLSGGQQQRVAIAMAFLLRPQVIVLDEPTTGLDVTTQAHVLRTVERLCERHNVAALYVSHDLAVVGQISQRTIVLYAGRLAEIGTTAEIFRRTGHPYTRGLISAIPAVHERRALQAIPGQAPPPARRPQGCFFAPRCEYVRAECRATEPPTIELRPGHFARCVRAGELGLENVPISVRDEPVPPEPTDAPLVVDGVSAFHGDRQVLYDISLYLGAGECLAIAGESGSGKTTLARAIIGLHDDWTGSVALDGERLARRAQDRTRDTCQRLQYIFQSPFGALNPRRTVGESIALPLRRFSTERKANLAARVEGALEQVSLTSLIAERYPDELSGGERQRAAIARALVCDPRVLICDEVTSALDVSLQAALLGVLSDLRARGLSMLFVTHDLGVVRSIADRVAVIRDGRLIETGRCASVLADPADPYTKALLADSPTLGPVPDRTAVNPMSAS